MHKAKILINSIKKDSTLNNNTYSMHSRIDLLRSNGNITKLTFLIRNSEAVTNIVKDTILEWVSQPKHDFRVFSLLVALVDGNRFEVASGLSRMFVQDCTDSNAKIIATNILLKESLYDSK